MLQVGYEDVERERKRKRERENVCVRLFVFDGKREKECVFVLV